MFERPDAGERAVLVHMSLQTGQEDLFELEELARSAGAVVAGVLHGSRRIPDSKYFIGEGKLQELLQLIREESADIVLFNHQLSPRQEKNLEQALQTRVIDRTGLILDIFAQRAQTHEGKLQVELAQLHHLSTRLVRGWTHLERQKGGIGLRGPGETQLETDRRLIRQRMRSIRQRLEKVSLQRHQGRAQRKKSQTPSVSLVGYTNAGKSTLFNRLTKSNIYAANQLFATLDPTLRRLQLTNGLQVVIADTVGFIRHLPHELVAAFRSTLQEAVEADLLLHVIDANAEDRDETIFQVNNVLEEIGCGNIRQLRVFNKIDLMDDVKPKIERDEYGDPSAVWVSAKTGVGMDLIRLALQQICSAGRVRKFCHLKPSQGGVRARLFDSAHVLWEEIDESGGWKMEIEIDKKFLGLLKEIDAKEIA
ncbi:MAG: ribosome rescue GTPase HflX [Gammaproteobacteria bacterium]